jgi:hypothetical protein
MFADHLPVAAKLFQAANAVLTASAVCQIMYADAIARRDMLDVGTDFFDPPCDFVPERYRQTVNPGKAGAIMFVRMTDPAGPNPNQNIGRIDLWNWKFNILQRLSDLSEPYCSHNQNKSHFTARLVIFSADTPSFGERVHAPTIANRLQSRRVIGPISSLQRRAREKLRALQVNRN